MERKAKCPKEWQNAPFLAQPALVAPCCLQPELLNGILARVQLCGNDTQRCKHGEAAVVDFSLLS